MPTDIEFLVLFAEVSVAFVAFTTIVATLRQSMMGALRPLQYLLFRFFVDVGLMHFLVALIPVGLFYILEDEVNVWRITSYFILVFTACYMPNYLARRRRIDAPVPLVSLMTMVGYGVVLLIMVITVTEWFWLPSLATTTIFLLWGMCSNVAIFALFLGSFVSVADGGSGRLEAEEAAHLNH
ncbi:MAG: hypothetical protein ACE363_10115 [Alphaproteobacteria bacterium]